MTNPETIEAAPKYEDLAGMVEYSMLRPDLSEEDVARGCETAKRYGLAGVVVRPSDVDLVTRWMAGSSVQMGVIVDSPHGYAMTSTKLFATRDLLRRGARLIDTVLNTSKLISRQFQYLETELLQMADSCHESGALLSVNLASEFLTEELKIIACRILRRAGADYVGTKDLAEIPLLQMHSRERLKIKSLADVSDLDGALAARSAGCARIQLSDPAPLLDAWKERLAAAQAPPQG